MATNKYFESVNESNFKKLEPLITQNGLHGILEM